MYPYSLEEKMTAAYEDSEWRPVRWERDMHCAVKVPPKSQWRRGQIIRVVTDTLVEVNAELNIIMKVHFNLFCDYLFQFLLCFAIWKKILEMLPFPKFKFTVLIGLAIWCGCWTSSEYSLFKRTSRKSKDNGKIIFGMFTRWYKVVFS